MKSNFSVPREGSPPIASFDALTTQVLLPLHALRAMGLTFWQFLSWHSTVLTPYHAFFTLIVNPLVHRSSARWYSTATADLLPKQVGGGLVTVGARVGASVQVQMQVGTGVGGEVGRGVGLAVGLSVVGRGVGRGVGLSVGGRVLGMQSTLSFSTSHDRHCRR